MGARWGPAVGSASHRGLGVPVPPVEEDLDPLLIAVEGGQSLEQPRLITRDDDETARHVVGPPSSEREAGNALATFKLRTIRRFVRRGKHKMHPPTDPPPGLVVVPLKGVVLVIPERVYVAGLRLGKTLRRREARERYGRDRSVVRTTSVRASEDVAPLGEIVPWVQGAAACSQPSLDRNGPHGLPALPLPPIKDDRDSRVMPDRPLKGTVQLRLAPRHNQQVQRRRTGWCALEAIRANGHWCSPRRNYA